MQPAEQRPLIVLLAAHPIWNVPPFFNAARLLAKNGFRVIVIGYQQGDLARRERICDHAVIFRVAVRSRSISLGPIRKFCSLFEFLRRSRRIIHRLKPALVTVFNDPTSLILKHLKRQRIPTVCWLLEYPEADLAGRLEGLLMRFCQQSWQRGDALVVPNHQRLALHLSLRPECQYLPCFVVHNAPPGDAVDSLQGEAAEKAIHEVRRARERGNAVVVYSGAVGIRYGIQTLLQAVLEREGVFLLILGKQHDLAVSEVSEIAPDYDTNERIRWIDEIPYRDLPSVLKEADIGFVHYIGENLNTRFSAPGKLYEYMRAGLAVLSLVVPWVWLWPTVY